MNHHLNAVYTSEEKENFNPMDFVRKARVVMGFPLLMPDAEPRSFETIMNPVHPVSMNLSISKLLFYLRIGIIILLILSSFY